MWSVVPRCPLRLEHAWGVGWGMASTATSAGIGFHVPVLEGPRRAERLLTLHLPSSSDLVPFEQREHDEGKPAWVRAPVNLGLNPPGVS